MGKTSEVVAKDEYPKDFFHFNRVILRCAGLWAPTNVRPSLKILYNVYAVFVVLFVNLWFTATEFASLSTTYKNLYDLIKNINFTLTHLMGAIKCIFWHSRGSRLLAIIDTLESKEFSYENTTIFNQGEIFKKAKKTGFTYTLTFFMLAHMTLSSSYVPPLIATINFEDEFNNRSFHQKLPYYSWMPFEYNTPTLYLVGLGYQAGPMFSYAYSIVGMDTLFMNIMNFIVAHLCVVQGSFRTIRERSLKQIKGNGYDGLNNSTELSTIMKKEMTKSIKHLQTIFGVCEELERIHKYLTLGQVMATLFILCTCLFLVSSTNDPKQVAAEVVYMVAMCFQLVLYCWFGNEVTREAGEIPSSLWESDWLGATKEFKVSMVMTMVRMKRRVVLTVGEFAPLTLSTFVAILKGSYSFFAVLKNTN